jgi:HPr kinase/phosphorylase
MEKNKFCVRDVINDLGGTLTLSSLNGDEGLSRVIKVPDLYRLGMPLCGHYQYFPAERVQIFGLAEHSYLESLSTEKRYEILKSICSIFPQIPCIIVTRSIEPVKELAELAREYSIPLLRSPVHTARLMAELTAYLEEKLAPTVVVQGVLVNVYGLGILLTGVSSIGKSECALELLKRGHMFVADDIINVKMLPGGILTGTGEELIRYHMELRGIGIIDILSIFGIGSYLEKTRIELVVRLVEWNKAEEYDRLGLENRKTKILDVEIPEIMLPVRPGRNLAALVEISALNQRLKQKGYYAARALNEKIIKLMEEKKQHK